MADASVRAAGPADVAEIARLQLDTWRIGYARLLPADLLAGLTPDRAETRWAAAVATPPSTRHHVLVACEQEVVVGFVALGPADRDDPDEAPAAGPDRAPDPDAVGVILTLLVEPRWGRRGHGSRLLAAAVDHLRADGVTHALTWVPDADTASIALYESSGWEPDGYVRTLDADGHRFREIRLHTRLD